MRAGTSRHNKIALKRPAGGPQKTGGAASAAEEADLDMPPVVRQAEVVDNSQTPSQRTAGPDDLPSQCLVPRFPDTAAPENSISESEVLTQAMGTHTPAVDSGSSTENMLGTPSQAAEPMDTAGDTHQEEQLQQRPEQQGLPQPAASGPTFTFGPCCRGRMSARVQGGVYERQRPRWAASITRDWAALYAHCLGSG